MLTALQLQTVDQLSQLRSSHVRLQLWLINEQDAEKVFLSTYKQTTEQRTTTATRTVQGRRKVINDFIMPAPRVIIIIVVVIVIGSRCRCRRMHLRNLQSLPQPAQPVAPSGRCSRPLGAAHLFRGGKNDLRNERDRTECQLSCGKSTKSSTLWPSSMNRQTERERERAIERERERGAASFGPLKRN